jgi:uncharacterized protein
MTIHIIIDGYNLIRNYPPLALLEQADFSQGRNYLLEWLSDYQRRSKHPISVIFDGGKGGGLFEERDHYKGIKILYSRLGQTADEVIKRIAAKEGEKALVVTSDQELSFSCRAVQSGTIRSEEFAHLVKKKEIDTSDSPEMEDEPEDRPKKKKGLSHRPSKKTKNARKHWEQL